MSRSNNDLGLLLLRVGFSALLLTHGIPKFMKLFSGGEIQFADPIGIGATATLVLAVFAEVICAVLVLIGFRVRLTSIPIIITMLVAVLIVHGDDPFGKKEFPLLYLIGFTAIALLGAGKYALKR
jgi:putative oxidoreductase